MRLILVDVNAEIRSSFYPLSLSRPIWELRCGMTTLGEKLIAKLGATDVACFVPEYMTAAYRQRTDRPVNDRRVTDLRVTVHHMLAICHIMAAATGDVIPARAGAGATTLITGGPGQLPEPSPVG